MSEPNYKSIFISSLAIEDQAARADYLNEACGGDAALRDRVESLLAAHNEAAEFMQSPTAGQTEPVPGPCLGEMIGRYKLREKLGEGGMGIVYIAEQTEPVRRKVALKIIKPGMDTREVVARFQAERQALAMMDHPNVARVFDGGATDAGYPYFVMELVRGVPITEYCDQASLHTQSRLELFLTVCGAVQHAHQRGIIHRDIKPSNVLVSLHDGVPAAKVIDFGVAKAVNQQLTQLSVYTRFQQIIGTPLYMSPEQAELSGLDIDTRTDVYSLGVLLYELLTGVTPFDKQRFLTAAYDEMRRIIREDEPPKPSTRVSSLTHADQTEVAKKRGSSPGKLSQSLRGELDWIVTKALEKDRSRRYDSAADLAADVQCYLRQEPVKAVAPSRWYKLRKLAARNKLIAAASLAVLTTLLVGIALTSWLLIEARRNQIAEMQQTYMAEMLLAQRAYEEFDTASVLELLLRQIPAQGQPDFRDYEWRELWTACNQHAASLQGHTGDVRKMTFSPDGTLLASESEDLSIRVWDLASMRQLATFQGQPPSVPYDLVLHACDFSPDGRYLATQFGAGFGSPDLVLWDVEALRAGRMEVVKRIAGATDNVYCLKFTPNSRGVAVGSVDGRLRIVDIETKAITEFHDESLADLQKVESPESVKVDGPDVALPDLIDSKRTYRAPDFPQAHAAKVTSIDFADEGRTMVSSGFDPSALLLAPAVKVWDVKEGILLHAPTDPADEPLNLHTVAITSNGQAMVCAGEGGRVDVWQVDSGERIKTIDVNAYGVNGLAFSASDTYLGVALLDQRLQIFETASWEPIATLRHPRGCRSVAFAPTGDLLATGGDDPAIRLWKLGDLKSDLLVHEAPVRSVRYSQDGRYLAVGTSDGAVTVWNTITNEPTLTISSPEDADPAPTETTYLSQFFAFDRESRYLAVVGPADSVTVWDVERRESIGPLEHGEGVRVYAVAFSPDVATLLTGTNRQDIVSWDWQNGRRNGTQPMGKSGDYIRDLQYSPDGRKIACACLNVHVLDAASLAVKQTLRPENQINNAVLSVAFSPDGEWLAAAEGENVVSLWSLNGDELFQLSHQTPVLSVAFSPEGNRLVSSDFGATTILWDLALKRQVANYSGCASDFHPDGNILACGNLSGVSDDSAEAKTVRLLRARTFEEIDREVDAHWSPTRSSTAGLLTIHAGLLAYCACSIARAVMSSEHVNK